MIRRERIPLQLSRIGLSSVVMLMLATLPAWAHRAAAPPREVAGEHTEVLPAKTTPAPAVPLVATEVRVVAQESAVPDDARKLMERYSEQRAAAYREAEEKIERQRRDVIAKLQQIQDTHTKAGRLDEAIEVRELIRGLNRTAAAASVSVRGFRPTITVRGGEGRFVSISEASRVPLTSFSLQSLRGRTGETMTLPVVGATEGAVWGNGVYTDDSSLAVAAVHAGLVAPGHIGFVRVTVLPGQDHYEEATANGVTSHSFGEWPGSFKVEHEPNPSPVIGLGDTSAPAASLALQSLRGQAGATLTVEIVGAASGEALWGTDEYTDDSSVALAAVHAGILRPGQRGLVKVTILPGRSSYDGSERNGVKSAPYASWGGSFRVEPVTGRVGR